MARSDKNRKKRVFHAYLTEEQQEKVVQFLERSIYFPNLQLRRGDVIGAILLTAATENVDEFMRLVRKNITAGI